MQQFHFCSIRHGSHMKGKVVTKKTNSLPIFILLFYSRSIPAKLPPTHIAQTLLSLLIILPFFPIVTHAKFVSSLADPLDLLTRDCARERVSTHRLFARQTGDVWAVIDPWILSLRLIFCRLEADVIDVPAHGYVVPVQEGPVVLVIEDHEIGGTVDKFVAAVVVVVKVLVVSARVQEVAFRVGRFAVAYPSVRFDAVVAA